jgi:hypothetical protein
MGFLVFLEPTEPHSIEMNKKLITNLKTYILSDAGSESSKNDLALGFFRDLFGNKFKKETEAEGADGYVEGKLVLELKSEPSDAIAGLFQGLHYHTKGLTFTTVCVVCRKFIALWKVKDLPDFVKVLADEASPTMAPNEVGRKNAKRVNKGQANTILECASFKILTHEFEEQLFRSDPEILLSQFKDYLENLEAERIQIRPSNFIAKIKLLEKLFVSPMEAIHCFYAMVGYWGVNSRIQTSEGDRIQLADLRTGRISGFLDVRPLYQQEFKKIVENHYVFVNSGSGLTADYYFSRFDEVISRLDPGYAKQHGIFFTDDNLSKFALWFVHRYFEKRLSDKYIVVDPAGGSGNLVTSWRGHMKHKIVSELQPDLLRTIEQRMRLDPEEVQAGFTIIPKTTV